MLTCFEREMARFVAGRRQDEAIAKGLQDKHGFDGDPLQAHVIGCVGELATAKALGVYWGGSVNTFRTSPDVGPIEVRTRTKKHYQLLVRPNDSDSSPYVHVVAEINGRNVPACCDVRGWLFGRDAKRAEWMRSHGGRPGAFFVPDSALYGIDSLKQAFL